MNNESELPEPLFAFLSSPDYCYFNVKECTCFSNKYCYGMGDKRACDVEDVEQWTNTNNNPEDYE